MDNEFGGDFISMTDEEGNEVEFELLDVLQHNGIYYHAFIPVEEGEEDEEEEVEIVILKVVETDGEELFVTIDDEAELNKVYDLFMERLDEE